MPGNEPGEIIPGVRDSFSKTGISLDAGNVWVGNSMAASTGNFDKLKPVRHYEEYFRGQDLLYQDVGKPGLLEAVMRRSNPKAVAAFDQLVDEFNADLERIKNEKDNGAVQAFFRRQAELQDRLPEN